MKTRILIIISSVMILISTFTVHATFDLGEFRGGPELDHLLVDGRLVLVSTTYWQFGILTTFTNGWPPIIYYYGQEDLPCCYGKGNIENFANINEDIHVYVYEANEIANPIHSKHKIVKEDVGYQLQNLLLNLERGRLYIVVFSDEKGAVLDVQKILLNP